MYRIILSLLLSVIFISTAILGCSGGKNPVAPEKPASSLDNIPIINLTDAGDASNDSEFWELMSSV